MTMAATVKVCGPVSSNSRSTESPTVQPFVAAVAIALVDALLLVVAR